MSDFEDEQTDNVLLTQTDKVYCDQENNIDNNTDNKQKIDVSKEILEEETKSSHLPILNNSNNVKRKHNFNFKDPNIAKAMDNLGLLPADLKYPTEKDLNEYSRDPNIRKSIMRALNEEIDRRIKMVNEELIKIEKERTFTRTPPLRSMSSVKNNVSLSLIEESRIRKVEERNKREVEQLILGVLTRKYQVEDSERRMQLELKKKKELEEKLRERQKQERLDQLNRLKKQQEEIEKLRQEERVRRSKEEEEMKALIKKKQQEEKEYRERQKLNEMERQKKLDLMKKANELKELEKEKKMLEMAKKLEEKEQKRLHELEEIEKRRKEENEIENQKRAIALKKVILNRRQKLEEIRKKAIEQEKKVQMLLEERKMKIEECKILKQEQEERKKKHREEIGKQKQKEFEEKAKAIIDKDIEATERKKQRDQEIEDKQRQAREGSSEKQIKAREKIKEIEEIQRRKAQEFYIKEKEREERIKKQEEEDNRRKEEQRLLKRIEMERKRFAVLRAERKAIVIANRAKTAATELQKRQSEIEKTRNDALSKVLKRKAELAIERKNMQITFAEVIHRASGGGDKELKKLAEKYGIDYDELDKRARNPKAYKCSVAELISRAKGTSENNHKINERGSLASQYDDFESISQSDAMVHSENGGTRDDIEGRESEKSAGNFSDNSADDFEDDFGSARGEDKDKKSLLSIKQKPKIVSPELNQGNQSEGNYVTDKPLPEIHEEDKFHASEVVNSHHDGSMSESPKKNSLPELDTLLSQETNLPSSPKQTDASQLNEDELSIPKEDQVLDLSPDPASNLPGSHDNNTSELKSLLRGQNPPEDSVQESPEYSSQQDQSNEPSAMSYAIPLIDDNESDDDIFELSDETEGSKNNPPVMDDGFEAVRDTKRKSSNNIFDDKEKDEDFSINFYINDNENSNSNTADVVGDESKFNIDDGDDRSTNFGENKNDEENQDPNTIANENPEFNVDNEDEAFTCFEISDSDDSSNSMFVL